MTLPHACRRLALALGLLAALAVAHPALAGDADAAPMSVATAQPVASAPRQVLVMLRTPTAHARLDGGYGATGYGDAARAQSQARVGGGRAQHHQHLARRRRRGGDRRRRVGVDRERGHAGQAQRQAERDPAQRVQGDHGDALSSATTSVTPGDLRSLSSAAA